MTNSITKMTLAVCAPVYKNNGQQAEYVATFTLCGQGKRPDNVPCTLKPDFMDIQIKGNRATICKGLDIKAHVAHDTAKRYMYVTKDFTTAYIMTLETYIEFCETFKTVTTESKYNGEGIKTRLKHEGKAMLKWLEDRVGG